MRRISRSLIVVAALSAGCGADDGASTGASGSDVLGDVAGDAAADTSFGGGDTSAAPDTALPDAQLDSGGPPADATADGGSDEDVAVQEDAAAGADVATGDVADATAADVADAGATPDATPDAAPDASPDAATDTVDPPACDPADLADPGDEDRLRVVLISHPFTSTIGLDGTDIRSMSLDAGGLPVDDGMILDVGVRPARIAFVPSGAYALVVGEDGDVISVAVNGAADIEVVDAVKLPSADYGDIAISAEGNVAWIVGKNVNETSGVSVVHIGCDGTLSVDTAGYLNIRLSESIAVLPGEQTAVLLGGQTVFAPVDPNDIRLLERDGDAWVEVGALDIFADFVNTGRIAASPDGSRVLVPNSSAFSDEEGDISVLYTGPGAPYEEDRITTLSGVSEALFSPDGLTALISRPEVNRVAILSDTGAGLEVTGEVKGIGLADHMALIDRGTSKGLVLIPSVDVNGGPNVAALRIDGVGVVTDLGQVELGAGSAAIPDAIAVMR